MNKLFFGKLAVSNLKKNRGLYLPYLLTAVGISTVFYIMLSITGDAGIRQMAGAESLQMILGFGCAVVGIFAVIFLFYTNSFLIKRRKKEFGLFNILGMEKRHIGKMMFWETLILAVICIVGGLICGIVLNKLIVLLLLRMTHLEVPFGFSVSFGAIRTTAILMAAIFAATLLFNLHQVQKAKPIELLQSPNQGETEPKTRWLLSLIGLTALAGGYWIAITTKDPLAAILLFFVAVILVMIGTYCLFTAGSIAVLKMLRRNKKYYYKTRHFTSVSGMIYRMKQNAVGLANICILSTAVLVILSSTVSMYAGMEDIAYTRYPNDILVTGRGLDEQQREKSLAIVEQTISQEGLAQENLQELESLTITGVRKDNEISLIKLEDQEGSGGIIILAFMTMEDYARVSGITDALKEDEVLVYQEKGKKIPAQFSLQGRQFQVKRYLDTMKNSLDASMSMYAWDTSILIVKDRAVLSEIDSMQKSIYGDRGSQTDYSISVDVSGTPEQEKKCAERITAELKKQVNENIPIDSRAWVMGADSREQFRENSYVFYGGFLFLGIFLGFVFLMATVMIIYYKQISEGYEDKERFAIMQKVGMSHKEVHASIRSQILKVFFLPLVMACIHLTAAFPLVSRLLTMFNMTNTGLFVICSIITVAVFAVIYGIVYSITARAYYKIVD